MELLEACRLFLDPDRVTDAQFCGRVKNVSHCLIAMYGLLFWRESAHVRDSMFEGKSLRPCGAENTVKITKNIAYFRDLN